MSFSDDEKPFPADQYPDGQPEKQAGASAGQESAEESASAQEPVLPISPSEEVVSEFDFLRMDEDVAAFRRELNEIQFAVDHPPEPESEPAAQAAAQPARRRRRNSSFIEIPDASQLGERFGKIAQLAAPSVDFFVFSFLSGCILGIGYILDAPAILLLGILVAPLLAPLVGFALAAATGGARFFGQTAGGLIISLAMVFGVGILSSLASRIFQPLTFSQAFYHARLWWPDLLMLIIGTVILVIAFIQSDDKPLVASFMLAYEIFLPASAAGFGLGSGVQGLWPEAGLVLLIHLALALIISLILLFYMGFRPLGTSGYFLTGALAVVGILIMISFAGIGSLINVRGDQVSATPTATPHSTASLAATQPVVVVPSLTTIPSPTRAPTATLPVVTLTPAATLTPAPTLLPTPVYGRVQSDSGGVYVRVRPGGATITTVQNGYLVEILRDDPVILNGATWVHVIIKTPNREIDGWVLLELISTATPSGSP